MQALPKVGRMEVRARATHAANHLSDTFEPRTEGGWRVEMWFQAGVRRRRGDVGANLNSPVGQSDGGEAGGGAAQLTRKDGRTPPRHDESERGGARDVHDWLSPHDDPNHARREKVSVIV